MSYYIKPNYADAQRLNAILYYTYVTHDGVNFIFPFQPGTTEYIKADPSEPVFFVTDLMFQAQTDPQISSHDQLFIQAVLAAMKDEAAAIAAGWIPDPNVGL